MLDAVLYHQEDQTFLEHHKTYQPENKVQREHYDKETLARARDEAVLRNIVYVGNIASLLKCTENINSNKVMIRVKVKVQGPQFLWISVTIHFKKNVHCPNFPLIHASWTRNWIANCKSRNIKF